MTDTQHRLAPQVIFGLCDGAMSILGVVFYAAGHRSLVLPLAVSGGLSAACSMAGSEWLSDDSQGFATPTAMFTATLVGSVLPAVPYAVAGGLLAPALSVVILAAVAAVVGRMRPHRKHPYLETAGILAAVVAVSIISALLIPA